MNDCFCVEIPFIDDFALTNILRETLSSTFENLSQNYQIIACACRAQTLNKYAANSQMALSRRGI